MPANIWDEICWRIQEKVNRVSYDTWFLPTAFVAENDRLVTVRVPNPLFRDWIVKHYSILIAQPSTTYAARMYGSVSPWPGFGTPISASIQSTSDWTASITNSAPLDAMSV